MIHVVRFSVYLSSTPSRTHNGLRKWYGFQFHLLSNRTFHILLAHFPQILTKHFALSISTGISYQPITTELDQLHGINKQIKDMLKRTNNISFISVHIKLTTIYICIYQHIHKTKYKLIFSYLSVISKHILFRHK